MIKWYVKAQIWWRRQEGSALTEYVMIGLLAVGAAVLLFPSLRAALKTAIDKITTNINNN